MNIAIQKPSATFAFGGTGSAGNYASLSGVGSGVTTAGQKTIGAVELSSLATVTKKGVVRALIQCRVPLFDLLTASDNAAISGSVLGSSKAGYAQVTLTVTLPNTAGIVATSSDFSSGVPINQSAANAAAVALATQIVLNAICDQGTGVLATGKSLMDYELLGTDVSDNPIARGLMGLTPLSGSDRSIKQVSAG